MCYLCSVVVCLCIAHILTIQEDILVHYYLCDTSQPIRLNVDHSLLYLLRGDSDRSRILGKEIRRWEIVHAQKASNY